MVYSLKVFQKLEVARHFELAEVLEGGEGPVGLAAVGHAVLLVGQVVGHLPGVPNLAVVALDRLVADVGLVVEGLELEDLLLVGQEHVPDLARGHALAVLGGEHDLQELSQHPGVAPALDHRSQPGPHALDHVALIDRLAGLQTAQLHHRHPDRKHFAHRVDVLRLDPSLGERLYFLGRQVGLLLVLVGRHPPVLEPGEAALAEHLGVALVVEQHVSGPDIKVLPEVHGLLLGLDAGLEHHHEQVPNLSLVEVTFGKPPVLDFGLQGGSVQVVEAVGLDGGPAERGLGALAVHGHQQRLVALEQVHEVGPVFVVLLRGQGELRLHVLPFDDAHLPQGRVALPRRLRLALA